jgi:hypothetical protein
MFEALKDVASSGLIECTCTSDTCAGSCTITLVRKAIQKAEGT